MIILRMLNKALAALLLTLFFTPLIALLALARAFNFIDLLYRGKIGQALFSFIFSPFSTLFITQIGVVISCLHGWRMGLVSLVLTFPERIAHFFKKQLLFGRHEGESVRDFFVSQALPSGLDDFVTSGFFGGLTLKLLSLCLPMEFYLSYDAKTVSPHNDVSIYFTEKNLAILKQKYKSAQLEQSAEITLEINDYLSLKHSEMGLKIQALEHLSFDDDTRAGALQSARDELDTIETAQRCVKYFSVNETVAPDLAEQFQCSTLTVLQYIWLAINTESANEQDNFALKEKLIWTLFQIQRGFNIVNGGRGADMPECPSGAIGLLVRVICDEQEKMPDSEYTAADPSPANLTLALKTALDRPFTNSYTLTEKAMRLADYNKNPQSYKQQQKENITKVWSMTFKPSLESGVLQADAMKEIIEEGVEAWEPPAEQDNSHAFTI